MPEYAYKCECGNEWETFYKSLPSEKLQNGCPCPECGKAAKRVLSQFYIVGTQNSGQETAASFGMPKADIGGRLRPVFKDAQGQVHEAKTSKDIDLWRKSNHFGKPEVVEWRNPKTGEKSWVPKRQRMIADPETGDVMEKSAIVKRSAELVPLDEGDFTMPTHTRAGIPIDQSTGTIKPKGNPADRMPLYRGRPIPDPETGKPFTFGNMWEGPSKPSGNGKAPAGIRKVLEIKPQ